MGLAFLLNSVTFRWSRWRPQDKSHSSGRKYTFYHNRANGLSGPPGRGVKLTTLIPRLKNGWSFISTPLYTLMAQRGKTLSLETYSNAWHTMTDCIQLHDLESWADILGNKTRRIWWAGHVASSARQKHVRWWNPHEKTLLSKYGSRWVDNIKMDFKEDGIEWAGLMWLRIGRIGGILWIR